MIARVWRGWTSRDDADAYVDYLSATGKADSLATEGNLGFEIWRRDDGDRTQFVTVILWDSLDAVRRFAGDDVERAVFYPEDENYLVDRELTVSHYEIVASRESDRST